MTRKAPMPAFAEKIVGETNDQYLARIHREAPSVKCIDCKHAEWVRTPNGRLKANRPGRCGATMPPPIVALWMPTWVIPASALKPGDYGLSPENKGRCDLYEPLSPPPETP